MRTCPYAQNNRIRRVFECETGSLGGKNRPENVQLLYVEGYENDKGKHVFVSEYNLYTLLIIAVLARGYILKHYVSVSDTNEMNPMCIQTRALCDGREKECQLRDLISVRPNLIQRRQLCGEHRRTTP
jgi:hypothetical protein